MIKYKNENRDMIPSMARNKLKSAGLSNKCIFLNISKIATPIVWNLFKKKENIKVRDAPNLTSAKSQRKTKITCRW